MPFIQIFCKTDLIYGWDYKISIRLWLVYLLNQKSSTSRILLHSLNTSFRFWPKKKSSPRLHISKSFLLCFWRSLNMKIVFTLAGWKSMQLGQQQVATRPCSYLQKLSKWKRSCRPSTINLHPSKGHHNCTLLVI